MTRKYNIRLCRDCAGLSQPELAAFIATYVGQLLPYSTISRHETIDILDGRKISGRILTGYAQVFDIHVAYLHALICNKELLLEHLYEVWDANSPEQLRELIKDKYRTQTTKEY